MDIEEMIVRALKHEEIPRCPSFLQGVMPAFSKAWETKYGDSIDDDTLGLTGVKDCTLHMSLGFDSSWAGFSGPWYQPPKEFDAKLKKAQNKLTPEEKAQGYSIGSNGGKYKTVTFIETNTTNHFLQEGTLLTEDDWNDWYAGWTIHEPDRIFDPIKQFNAAYHQALGFKKPHMLIPTCGMIMETIIGMFPISRLAYFARKNPTFLHKVCDWIVKPMVEKVKLMAESDAAVLMTPDDCAYKGRPILSPPIYKEFIIPRFKKYIDLAHKKGKPLMMHSDGIVEPYYNDLIAAGLDCHQSVEPIAGNNLAELKAKYGKRLAFVGNIDCSVLLPYGTRQEVIDATKACLKAGMPNSGYMFSPCTDLTDSCKLENAETMMETYRKYRNYPVNIQ